MKKAEQPPPASPEPEDYSPYDRLKMLMAESGVTEDEVREVVVSKGHYTAEVPVAMYGEKFITGWVIKYWPQILEMIDAGKSARN